MKTLRVLILTTFALALTLAAARTAAAQGKAPDLLTPNQVKELTASAATPADHLKLSRHYAALAAQYDAEAVDHAAIANVERTLPNPAETKRPGSPGTALHCDRLADNLRLAAKEARAVAAAHAEMAKTK